MKIEDLQHVYPEKGTKLEAVDRDSKYIVKVDASKDFAEDLFQYSKKFFEAAHVITVSILDTNRPDISKLDTYFFSIAFLYRHALELGLKAIAFQYIKDKEGRKSFVKDTRHNLEIILNEVVDKVETIAADDELEWLKTYFKDLSKKDKESDSFRYPFHIHKDFNGDYVIKCIFEEETHINLVKFANKFEAAYEIIQNWYFGKIGMATDWQDLEPSFIEEDGSYYGKSVVGYSYNRNSFCSYISAYLETANLLKQQMKNETDNGNDECAEQFFLPMCYLYRNCAELSLKQIWFQRVKEDWNVKCGFMRKKKHSIMGLWYRLKPLILEYNNGLDDDNYIEVIEDYCCQVHDIDSDASRFRYPMNKNMQAYFSKNKYFDFIHVGNFFEALNNILDGIDSQFSEMNEYIRGMEAEYRAEMESEWC